MSEVELAMELRSAPAGVALLESLARAQHRDVNWSEGPIDSDPIAVRAAVESPRRRCRTFSGSRVA